MCCDPLRPALCDLQAELPLSPDPPPQVLRPASAQRPPASRPLDSRPLKVASCREVHTLTLSPAPLPAAPSQPRPSAPPRARPPGPPLGHDVLPSPAHSARVPSPSRPLSPAPLPATPPLPLIFLSYNYNTLVCVVPADLGHQALTEELHMLLAERKVVSKYCTAPQVVAVLGDEHAAVVAVALLRAVPVLNGPLVHGQASANSAPPRPAPPRGAPRAPAKKKEATALRAPRDFSDLC